MVVSLILAMQWTAILWTVLSPVHAVESKCKDGDTIIPCTKIRGVGCCIKKSGCDINLDKSWTEPDAPKNLNLQVLENEENFPNLNITWAGPDSGASLNALTGFRINLDGDCFFLRFNTSLHISLLSEPSENVFNYTSGLVEYRKTAVRVQITSLPIPSEVLPWKQIATSVKLNRTAHIHYEINENTKRKCEVRVRVKDVYIESCNKVFLKKCNNSKCRTQSNENVFNSNQSVSLTVEDVPGVFEIFIMPSLHEGKECITTSSKGSMSRTRPFEVRGDKSSCFIFDPDMTTEGSSVSSALVSAGSLTEDPKTRESQERNDASQKFTKVTASILTVIGLAIAGVIIAFLVVKKKIKQSRLPHQDANGDGNLPNGHHNLDLSHWSKPIVFNSAVYPNAIIAEQHSVKILDCRITSTQFLLEWLPAMNNEEVRSYRVDLYNAESNQLISRTEVNHTSTESMSASLPIEDRVEKVFAVLAPVYSDETTEPIYSDVLTVPCPVNILDKKILIIYSDDFPDHEDTVTKFARLLATSKCSVMYEQWENNASTDRWSWYERSLREADKVIIIHSEGTYHKYEAYIHKTPVEDCFSRCLGDTFSLALELVLSLLDGTSMESKAFRAKLLHVHFSYTSFDHLRKSSPLVNRAATYCILANVKEFILSLHDLAPSSKQCDYETPGIDQTAVNRLQEAMDRAKNYMNVNPQWLLHRYDSGIESGYSPKGSSGSSDYNVPGRSDVGPYVPDISVIQRLDQLNSEEPENTYSQNNQLPKLSMNNNSDIYKDMLTPEVSTTLSPGVGPFDPFFHPPKCWSDSDSQSDFDIGHYE